MIKSMSETASSERAFRVVGRTTPQLYRLPYGGILAKARIGRRWRIVCGMSKEAEDCCHRTSMRGVLVSLHRALLFFRHLFSVA